MSDKRARLAEEATRLKKAWLLAAAVRGLGTHLSDRDLRIPSYSAAENKWLKRHIEELKADFVVLTKQIFMNWKRGDLDDIASWFANQFDAWGQAGFSYFDIGRIHELEKVGGPLAIRKRMDCPPYAQILLQGFQGAAIRHPEYHLATDLALLYNLFRDSQDLIDDAFQQQRLHSSEYNQSLGRSVIVTCYNLLESFASGLATAYLIENPNAPANVIQKISDKSLSLKKRFITVPCLISGKPNAIDETKPPFITLFGECKQRRDSFVHCEPGPIPTKWGYVKEEHFHDIDILVVRRTVDLTYEAISIVWNLVHGKSKPSWLPNRDQRGRFPRVQVKLNDIEGAEPPNIAPQK